LMLADLDKAPALVVHLKTFQQLIVLRE
jgi:hypothetical protein